jgi:hypothetical protein
MLNIYISKVDQDRHDKTTDNLSSDLPYYRMRLVMI